MRFDYFKPAWIRSGDKVCVSQSAQRHGPNCWDWTKYVWSCTQKLGNSNDCETILWLTRTLLLCSQLFYNCEVCKDENQLLKIMRNTVEILQENVLGQGFAQLLTLSPVCCLHLPLWRIPWEPRDFIYNIFFLSTSLCAYSDLSSYTPWIWNCYLCIAILEFPPASSFNLFSSPSHASSFLFQLLFFSFGTRSERWWLVVVNKSCITEIHPSSSDLSSWSIP